MLSDEEREALLLSIIGSDDFSDVVAHVNRIASDAARAAERALVEFRQRIEGLALELRQRIAAYPSHRDCTSWEMVEIDLREALAALRPEAATTEGAGVEPGGPVHVHGYAGEVCDICGWDGLAARPFSTRGSDDAAAVHPDTEGER